MTEHMSLFSLSLVLIQYIFQLNVQLLIVPLSHGLPKTAHSLSSVYTETTGQNNIYIYVLWGD